MDPIGLVVRFVLRPGHEEAFDRLMDETLHGIRTSEPGTLIYAVHSVEGYPSIRLFYELYEDADAFGVHELQPTTKHFLSVRDQHVESCTVERIRPLTMKVPDSAAGR